MYNNNDLFKYSTYILNQSMLCSHDCTDVRLKQVDTKVWLDGSCNGMYTGFMLFIFISQSQPSAVKH